MPNKHITHSDDSHFDISIKPNNRFDGEHTHSPSITITVCLLHSVSMTMN